MLDDLSVQKRAIIATLLAFIFFIGYDHFYLSKLKEESNQNQVTTEENLKNSAPTMQSKSQNIEQPKVDYTKKTIVDIKSKTFEANIDELGRISVFTLKDAIYKSDEGVSFNLVDSSFSPLPLEIRFSDNELNKKAFEIPYSTSISNVDLANGSKEIILTQDLGDVKVVKKIKFNANGSYELDVELNKDVEYFITPGMRPNIIVDSYTVNGLLLRNSEDNLEIIKDGKVKKGGQEYESIDIAAAFDRYYTTLFYNFDKPFNVIATEYTNNVNQLFIPTKGSFKTNGFIGPKNQELLKSVSPELTDVIEYGWFTFIAKPMFSFLSFLHKYAGNWGWAIVILTLIIRLVLFPLTYKGMVSMNKMKDLAPKIKEIQAKYKGEPQKMQAQVMQLYKKHGANPMGGCLPILLQIPVFFAIYRVLLNAIELQGAPWIFWIQNLAIKDPYFVLPIIMGLSMFLQQRLTPTNFTDPMQEKIMKFLPLIFTFFFMTFPAGLTLYWCVNNLCSVVQQLVVNKIFKKHKQEAVVEKK